MKKRTKTAKKPARRNRKPKGLDPLDAVRVMATVLLDRFMDQAIRTVHVTSEEMHRQADAMNLRLGAIAKAAASAQDRHTMANVFQRLKALEEFMDKQTGGDGKVVIAGSKNEAQS